MRPVRRWISRAVLLGGVVACAACTADLTELQPRDPLPVVHAMIVAGQHLQLVSVEWTATGAVPFTRDSIMSPDTAARVRWTTPDGQVLEAQPLWVRSKLRRDRGIYVVASAPADTVLRAFSRYRGISGSDLPRMDPGAVPGTYRLEVTTSRGQAATGAVTVHPRRAATRSIRFTGGDADTLFIRDTLPLAMPMSVATVLSYLNHATVLTDRGTLRLPLDAPGRTDRALPMFTPGDTSELVHYALDSALARAFWGATDPLHAGNPGNLSGALGTAGYVVPLTVARVLRTSP